MKLVLPHHRSKAQAREKVELLLRNLEERYNGYISDVVQAWNGDEMSFQFKAKGAKASGHIEVTDAEIVLNGKLPLIAKPFERKIRELIEREGERLFRTD